MYARTNVICGSFEIDRKKPPASTSASACTILPPLLDGGGSCSRAFRPVTPGLAEKCSSETAILGSRCSRRGGWMTGDDRLNGEKGEALYPSRRYQRQSVCPIVPPDTLRCHFVERRDWSCKPSPSRGKISGTRSYRTSLSVLFYIGFISDPIYSTPEFRMLIRFLIIAFTLLSMRPRRGYQYF